MKNKKITRKITQGMYVLTTKGGGCMVDAVSQISATDNPLNSFALSVLGLDVNVDIIKTFGLNSMRDINKFENIPTNEIMDLPIIEDSLGYMICEKIDAISNETHTLFIGRLIEADVYKEEPAMSYNYYQEHKDELLKIKTENGKTTWVCTICGYIYYDDTLPENYQCPVCGVGPEMFEKK